MAYNFFPTSPKDIADKISDQKAAAEIGSVLTRLRHDFPEIKDPLAINPTKPRTVKITRKLQGKLQPRDLKTQYINVSFGEGSRGGRGVGNLGNQFETELARDIENWWEGNDIPSQTNLDLIIDLIDNYDLDTWTDLYIDPEGAANKPRPLQFSGRNITIAPGLGDIGSVVTDITLRKGNTKTAPPGVYLSLKYSSTVTFFNAGTKKYLSDAELQSGLIKNSQGVALLDMFGINNSVFCSVFNGTLDKGYSEDTTSKINKTTLENLIKSGIGYGYHMVHKMGSEIVSKVVDKQYRDKASKVQGVKVYYGGKGGTGARVDIVVNTPVYNLKFNFRNKMGGKYISHLMCDYSYV